MRPARKPRGGRPLLGLGQPPPSPHLSLPSAAFCLSLSLPRMALSCALVELIEKERVKGEGKTDVTRYLTLTGCRAETRCQRDRLPHAYNYKQ